MTVLNCADQDFELLVCEISEDRLAFSLEQTNDEVNYLSLNLASQNNERIYACEIHLTISKLNYVFYIIYNNMIPARGPQTMFFAILAMQSLLL